MADETAPAAAPEKRGPGRPRKAPAPEPAFSDGGGGEPADHGVMDVNPTPREARNPDAPDPARQYIPSPFSGPAHLSGEDLARSGGGADQRVDTRQNTMAEKYRNDPAIKALMQEEAKKKFGALPDAPAVEPEDRRAAAADAAGQPAGEATGTEAATSTADEVAQIARLEREKRELRDRLKAADGARTAAKRLEMYQKIAEDYPIAAVRGLFGDDFVDKLYADDVAGKSKSIGDKYKNLDPSKALETDDAVSVKDRELQEERTRRIEAEREVSTERAKQQAASIARSDGKRWELCQREPNIGAKVVDQVKKLYAEASAEDRKGLDAIFADDAKSVALTRDILDDLEKEYDALGKRFSRGNAQSAPATRRPAPPAGQRSPALTGRPVPEHDRYSRPPRRESVEDRQDRMAEKYRGMKFTDE